MTLPDEYSDQQAKSANFEHYAAGWIEHTREPHDR
jgi:hypothetical protein